MADTPLVAPVPLNTIGSVSGVQPPRGLRIVGLQEHPRPPLSQYINNVSLYAILITNESQTAIKECVYAIEYKPLTTAGRSHAIRGEPFTLAAGESKEIGIGQIHYYNRIQTARGYLEGNRSYRVAFTLYGDLEPIVERYKMYVEGRRLFVHRM